MSDHETRIKGRAYGLFLSELEKHLTGFQELLKLPSVDRDRLLRAAATAHTLKGSSGFFGLNEFADTCAWLEETLEDPEFDWSKQRGSVQNKIEQLGELAAQLPEATMG